MGSRRSLRVSQRRCGSCEFRVAYPFIFRCTSFVCYMTSCMTMDLWLRSHLHTKCVSCNGPRHGFHTAWQAMFERRTHARHACTTLRCRHAIRVANNSRPTRPELEGCSRLQRAAAGGRNGLGEPLRVQHHCSPSTLGSVVSCLPNHDGMWWKVAGRWLCTRHTKTTHAALCTP